MQQSAYAAAEESVRSENRLTSSLIECPRCKWTPAPGSKTLGAIIQHVKSHCTDRLQAACCFCTRRFEKADALKIHMLSSHAPQQARYERALQALGQSNAAGLQSARRDTIVFESTSSEALREPAFQPQPSFAPTDGHPTHHQAMNSTMSFGFGQTHYSQDFSQQHLVGSPVHPGRPELAFAGASEGWTTFEHGFQQPAPTHGYQQSAALDTQQPAVTLAFQHMTIGQSLQPPVFEGGHAFYSRAAHPPFASPSSAYGSMIDSQGQI